MADLSAGLRKFCYAARVSLYTSFAAPLVRRLSPELAHDLAIQYLRLVPRLAGARKSHAILRQTLWGLNFPHPIGLAAGFDKNAQASDAVLRRGAAFVEVGTVTPKPQPGNSKPRIFRLDEDAGMINRLGFNSQGLQKFTVRMRRRHRREGIVGANVGKNRDSDNAVHDYVIGIEAVAPYSDFLVVNISSPNTPGLRDLQTPAELSLLLKSVRNARARSVGEAGRPPILVKIAPDLDGDQLSEMARVLPDQGADGVIATNTTIARPSSLQSQNAGEVGGLSGRPLKQASLNIVRELHGLLDGKIPIVGVGGIETGADAYAMIRAGASLVELYSAMTYEGFGIFSRIADDLAARLKAEGFETISQAVGSGT